MNEIELLKQKHLVGRDARLLAEWESIDQLCKKKENIYYTIRKRNALNIPIVYEVEFSIHSFCGVEQKDSSGLQKPLFSDKFIMQIRIPNNYPALDAKLEFAFLLNTITGKKISHPWHPNIRYFGDFAGRVCLNTDAYSPYTYLSHYVERVARYLRYDIYHARIGVPPYPEDDRVAEWVVNQAEPNGWIEQLRYENNNK